MWVFVLIVVCIFWISLVLFVKRQDEIYQKQRSGFDFQLSIKKVDGIENAGILFDLKYKLGRFGFVESDQEKFELQLSFFRSLDIKHQKSLAYLIERKQDANTTPLVVCYIQMIQADDNILVITELGSNPQHLLALEVIQLFDMFFKTVCPDMNLLMQVDGEESELALLLEQCEFTELLSVPMGYGFCSKRLVYSRVRAFVESDQAL